MIFLFSIKIIKQKRMSILYVTYQCIVPAGLNEEVEGGHEPESAQTHKQARPQGSVLRLVEPGTQNINSRWLKPGMRIRFWPKNRIRGSIPQANGDFKSL